MRGGLGRLQEGGWGAQSSVLLGGGASCRVMSLKCDSWVFSVVTHVTLKGVEGRGNDRAPEHPIPPGTLGAAALARTDASSRPWSRSPSGTDTVQVHPGRIQF